MGLKEIKYLGFVLSSVSVCQTGQTENNIEAITQLGLANFYNHEHGNDQLTINNSDYKRQTVWLACTL